MKTSLKITTAILISGLVMLLTMCKKSEPGSSGPNNSYSMYMTDSPGDYQQVNVNITAAEVNSSSTGWTALNVNAGVYNLLTLANGKDTLLASGSFSGTVSQVRLTLATTGNTVKVNNTLYPLTIPSGQEKVVVNSSTSGNSITLDFDAGLSVIAGASGSYTLRPVIRVVTPAASGSIKGIISPLSTEAAVFAIIGSDSSSAYSSIVTGHFLVQGLAAGTYKVVVVPMFPFSIATFSNITVNSGSVTDMSTITIL